MAYVGATLNHHLRESSADTVSCAITAAGDAITAVGHPSPSLMLRYSDTAASVPTACGCFSLVSFVVSLLLMHSDRFCLLHSAAAPSIGFAAASNETNLDPYGTYRLVCCSCMLCGQSAAANHCSSQRYLSHHPMSYCRISLHSNTYTWYGPFITGSDHKPAQSRLIAFLDDASRVCCHGQFFLSETIDSLITAFRCAFYKRGIPQQLYVDNGSIYSCKDITLIDARLGCILRHAPLRDGAAKGKIERFFRTVRDSFLARQLDLSSLDALNRQFSAWVEEHYNAARHSALGMRPIDRFGLDLARIRFLPPDQLNDELFFAQDCRKVKKDNTFSFQNTIYEAPVDLRDKSVTIRFDRTADPRVIVYFKNQRCGQAKPPNRIANGLLKRSSYKGDSL